MTETEFVRECHMSHRRTNAKHSRGTAVLVATVVVLSLAGITGSTTVAATDGPNPHDADGTTATAANFSVDILLTSSPVEAGDPLNVTATVENVGDEAGTQTLALLVGGAQRDIRRVTLEGAETRTVVLTWATGDGDGGDYTAAVATPNDTAETDVVVTKPTSDSSSSSSASASFVIDDVSTSSPVEGGDPLNATARIENVGDRTGTQTVRLAVAGTPRDERAVTLEPGEHRTVSLTWETGEGDGGTYAAAVATPNDTAETDVEIREPVAAGGGGSNEPPAVGSLEFLPGGDRCDGGAVYRAEASGGAGTLVIPSNWSERATLIATDATDPDGTVSSYEWTVEGTIVATGESLTHRFDPGGDHRVTLTVTDDDGATAERAVAVLVNDAPAVAVAARQSGENVPDGQPFLRTETASFAADASDPDGAVRSYEWRVDGAVASTDASFTHSFESGGEHRVTLTVTDDVGTTATTTRIVTVNSPPSASIAVPPTAPGVGESVTLAAAAADDGEVVSYEWVVDGEVVATGASLDTSFEESGEHEVTLVVTDGDGVRTSTSRAVTVAESASSPSGSGGSVPAPVAGGGGAVLGGGVAYLYLRRP